LNTRLIEERLGRYEVDSAESGTQALREITQELILYSLSTSDFFSRAAFQGGTCLRVVYGLRRFSEDMDFISKRKDPEFSWEVHLALIRSTLEQYGYRAELQDRSQADSAVKKAFIKDNSIGKVLRLSYAGRQGPARKIRIKLEIDTDPPGGGKFETKYLSFPSASSITAETAPTLLAGKSHALLCRRFEKGRDWYDFLWYMGRKTPVNYARLSAALDQAGPWKGQGLSVDRDWYVAEMKKRIQEADWPRAREDVAPFVPRDELRSLELWGPELFASALDWLH
jgi:hypothetical protein